MALKPQYPGIINVGDWGALKMGRNDTMYKAGGGALRPSHQILAVDEPTISPYSP